MYNPQTLSEKDKPIRLLEVPGIVRRTWPNRQVSMSTVRRWAELGKTDKERGLITWTVAGRVFTTENAVLKFLYKEHAKDVLDPIRFALSGGTMQAPVVASPF